MGSIAVCWSWLGQAVENQPLVNGIEGKRSPPKFVCLFVDKPWDAYHNNGINIFPLCTSCPRQPIVLLFIACFYQADLNGLAFI
jgi:hypothetical protein